MTNGNNGMTDWLSGGAWGSLNLLSGDPLATYYSSPKGLGFAGESPRQRQFFDQGYQDIEKEYLGLYGTAVRAGEEPATFQEFLQTNPWTTRYGRLSPAMRGTTGAAYNPRTRFLFNF
jgi:hypothetical protein